ncbi:MAG: SBBP repeat-containing protein, partial [Terracidiphilus sp.]
SRIDERSSVLPHASPVPNQEAFKGRFVLAGHNRVVFALEEYERKRALVIDPVLSYSTYFGGSGYDSGQAIAVDGAGNAYVTGDTTSAEFPTANPLQPSFGTGSSDVFVTKLNAMGSGLVYSTYLGGSASNWGTGIAVDSSGNAYVIGNTTSTDFPTAKPYQATNRASANARYSAFVAKLNAAGTGLLYSTYLGGSVENWGYGIAVDSSGNAYVTGSTLSADFPTAAALQAANRATLKTETVTAYVAKLNSAGSALDYSTYLGGSDGDSGQGIAVDSRGNAYVTGYTSSTDFPTVKPVQASNRGDFDAFVAKLNPDGSALVYSTYLGGSGVDYGYGIAVDSVGNAYVTGRSYSTDFPMANPLQVSYKGELDAFVAKLNPAGSAFIYSTYLGGSRYDEGNSIAVDPSGNAYVTGVTYSTDFPTAWPLQSRCGGCSSYADAFVAKLNAIGSALVYSTYLGGSGVDYGYGIAVDSHGNAYVTGETSSTDFPVAHPLEPSAHGNFDVFVTKISSVGPNPVSTVRRTERKAAHTADADRR